MDRKNTLRGLKWITKCLIALFAFFLVDCSPADFGPSTRTLTPTFDMALFQTNRSQSLALTPTVNLTRQFASVCQGIPVEGAAPYESGHASHPLVLEPWSYSETKGLYTLPDDWKTNLAEHVELVLCLEKIKEEQVDTCSYLPAGKVVLYRRDVSVRLLAARTGEEIYAKVIQGEKPYCPGITTFQKGEMTKRVYSNVPAKEIFSRVAPFVEAENIPREIPIPGVASAALSPDLKFLAESFPDGREIRVWSVEDLQQTWSFSMDLELPFSLVFSPDGKYLALGGHGCQQADFRDCEEGIILVWNLTTGEEKRMENQTGWMFEIAFAPNNRHIASSSLEGTLIIWNPLTGDPEYTYKLPGRNISFSGDGKYLVMEWGNVVYLADVETWQIVRNFSSEEYNFTDPNFSSDGTDIAIKVCTKSQPIKCNARIYEAETGLEKATVSEFTGTRFLPGGKILASIEKDTLTVAKVTDGQILFTVDRKVGEDIYLLETAVFSSDGQTLTFIRIPENYAGSEREIAIIIWDIRWLARSKNNIE